MRYKLAHTTSKDTGCPRPSGLGSLHARPKILRNHAFWPARVAFEWQWARHSYIRTDWYFVEQRPKGAYHG